MSTLRERYEGLPPRQRKVVDLVVDEYLTNPQIAKRLGLSHGTVRNYFKDVYIELGVESKLQMAVLITEMKRNERLLDFGMTRTFDRAAASAE